MGKPLFTILLLLSSSTAWASGMELLISRSLFHAGEVKLSARGQWWAVCDRPPDPQSLVPVTVQTKRVRDDYVDNNTEMTGIAVEVKGCERASFLVRGLKLDAKEFRGGTIESGLVATYASKTYTFQVNALGESGYQLELNGAGRGQTIFKAPRVSESIASNWRVEWVGDLDGDQKPDFLVQANDKDSVDFLHLLISSRAKPGRLVEEVASFTYAIGG